MYEKKLRGEEGCCDPTPSQVNPETSDPRQNAVRRLGPRGTQGGRATDLPMKGAVTCTTQRGRPHHLRNRTVVEEAPIQRGGRNWPEGSGGAGEVSKKKTKKGEKKLKKGKNELWRKQKSNQVMVVYKLWCDI